RLVAALLSRLARDGHIPRYFLSGTRGKGTRQCRGRRTWSSDCLSFRRQTSPAQERSRLVLSLLNFIFRNTIGRRFNRKAGVSCHADYLFALRPINCRSVRDSKGEEESHGDADTSAGAARLNALSQAADATLAAKISRDA